MATGFRIGHGSFAKIQRLCAIIDVHQLIGQVMFFQTQDGKLRFMRIVFYQQYFNLVLFHIYRFVIHDNPFV